MRPGAWWYAAAGALVAAFIVAFIVSGNARALWEWARAAIMVLGR